jgi:hypothetical protein
VPSQALRRKVAFVTGGTGSFDYCAIYPQFQFWAAERHPKGHQLPPRFRYSSDVIDRSARVEERREVIGSDALLGHRE